MLNEIAAAQLLGSRGSRILGQLGLWNCVGRMPPRKEIELALLVLRAFPALRAALWTCSEQPKVWCRRSSWKAQTEYSKFTKIQIYPPNSFLCIYPLRTPKRLCSPKKNRSIFKFWAKRAMDTCSISCPGSYWIKPLHIWIHEALKHPFSAWQFSLVQ